MYTEKVTTSPTGLLSRIVLLALTLVITACASPQPNAERSQGEGSPSGQTGKKILTALMNDEPKRLGPIGPGGGSLQSSSTTPWLYESFLIVLNDEGAPVPRLATEIPTIANGGWQVFP